MIKKKFLDGCYIYAILGIIVGIVIGIFLGNLIKFFAWNGWNADWVSAIGSWVSGIIAGVALFYAINKDKIITNKKVNKNEDYISIINTLVVNVNNYSEDLSKKEKDLFKSATSEDMDSRVYGSNDQAYKIMKEVSKLLKKINLNIDTKIGDLPEAYSKNITDLSLDIHDKCTSLMIGIDGSDSFDYSKIIMTRMDISNLVSILNIYSGRLTNLNDIYKESRKHF